MLYVLAMAKVLCPYCGERTRFAPRLFGLPYCVACGWRLERFGKITSRQAALINLIIAFVGILLTVGTIIRGWPIPIVGIYFICSFVFPVVLDALSWSDYQKIIVAEPRTVEPKPQDWMAHANAKYQTLSNASGTLGACACRGRGGFESRELERPVLAEISMSFSPPWSSPNSGAQVPTEFE